ncbi:13929_t:CDS:10 [Entrophospora sp. SA101]|nr:13929_t:CDS:10 [Entrophospora sp. SA101]
MLDFTDWKPDRFRTLHKQLELVSSSTTDSSLKDLCHKLQENKNWLVNLLDFPAQNSASRQKLQKGTVIINKFEYKFPPDIITETISISDFLKVDELFAATLFYHGTKNCTKFGRSAPETAILLFLQERGYLLVCLSILIGNSYNDDIDLSAREKLANFTNSVVDLISRYNKNVTFARKLMSYIDKLKVELTELEGRLEQLTTQSQTLISKEQLEELNKGFILVNFNADATKDRIRQTSIQRRYLAYNLWLYTYNYLLNPIEVIELTKMLKLIEIKDIVFPYLLTSLLSATDTTPEHIDSEIPAKQKHIDLITNKNFINEFISVVNNPSDWKNNATRAIIQIQLCVFILEAIKKDLSLEQGLSIREEQLSEMFKSAIVNDAFQFITHTLLSFQKTEMESATIEIAPGILNVQKTNLSDNDFHTASITQPGMVPKVSNYIPEDFQFYLRKQLEFFVISIIKKMMSNLQKIRRQEEDAIKSQKPEQIRHDIEAFLIMIAILYRDSPDEGLIFWTDLKHIINWGASFQEKGMMRAYLEMLCSLSTGSSSSNYADEFLSHEGWCSWQTLISALEEYNIGARKGEMQIREDEVHLIISFLRIFKQIVQHSINAHIKFIQSNVPKTLLSLAIQHIPTELKAEIYNAISSFVNSEYENYDQIAIKLWSMIEEQQIVPTVPKDLKNSINAFYGYTMQMQESWDIKREINEIESPNKLFFQTLAFVKLINSLIYIPNYNFALNCGLPVHFTTVPEKIGEGYRQPGIIPYISFILENIFFRAHSREYVFISQKWKILENSLNIIEKCLVSFDLTGPLFRDDRQLTTSTKSFQQTRMIINKDEAVVFNKEAITYLKNHPGFDIMKRLLSNSRLVQVIFEILVECLDLILEDEKRNHNLENCVLCCLKILWIAMEKQERFVEKVIPLAQENFPGYLENSFLLKKDIIEKISLYILCENPEICFYVVKILSSLSRSALFNSKERFSFRSERVNRLMGVLDSSPESDRILAGFVMRLDINIEEICEEISLDFQELELTHLCLKNWTKSNEEGYNAPAFLLNERGITFATVSFAVLDLILENLIPGKTPATISHFLLGYDFSNTLTRTSIKYLNQYDLRESCLHKVLEILGHKINEDYKYDIIKSSFSNYPAITSRCYQILYRLCADSSTSEATLLFLRNQGFIHKQLEAMPTNIFPSEKSHEFEPCLLTRYDKYSFEIDLATLCANLDERTWFMKIIALELHKSQTQSNIDNLLALVFGDKAIKSQSEDAIDEEIFASSPMKIIEILYMLEFEWDDHWKMNNPTQKYFDKKNIDIWMNNYKNEIVLYQLKDIYSELNQIYNHIQKRGLGIMQDDANLKIEMKQILKYCYFYNRQQELNQARYYCFKAWREILEIAVVNHYNRIHYNIRETVFHDILLALLSILKQESDAIGMVLSKVVLIIITALRLDHNCLSLIKNFKTKNNAQIRVHSERLYSIFNLIIDCLIGPSFSSDIRNNLYSSMYNYLHYIDYEPEDMYRQYLISQTKSIRSTRSIIDSRNLSVYRNIGDNLLDKIKLDASEGNIQGKLCALNILTAICGLIKQDKSNYIIDNLIKTHFVQNIVKSLSVQNELLKQSYGVRPDLNAIHARYVFTSRMNFLLRLAQQCDCAIKLIDYGVIDYLDQLLFLDDRPKFTLSIADIQEKSLYKDYHELLMSVLRFISFILTNIGHENRIVLNKISDFIKRHQGTFSDIFNDTPSMEQLTAKDATKYTISIMCIEELQELTRIFYFLGFRIENIDLHRKDTHQKTFQDFLKELMSRYFLIRKHIITVQDFDESNLQYIKEQIEYINRNLLSWCQVLSKFTPIFTPSLDFARRPDDNYQGNFELSIIVNYLRTSIDYLLINLKNYGKLSSQLEKGANELSNNTDELDESHQRSLAIRGLQDQVCKYLKNTIHYFYDVEVCLILLWRHFNCFIVTAKITSIKTTAGIVMIDIFEKLKALDDNEDVEKKFKSKNEFIQMSVRRLKSRIKC